MDGGERRLHFASCVIGAGAVPSIPVPVPVCLLSTDKNPSRPTPASFCSVFLSGIRKRKNVFQVTQYKTFQILVQTFPEPWARGSPSVFHFRNRQRFQVPGFEWVHELLLFCLASNPAQFCAEISCGKTELEHNCTISRFRMKNVSRFAGVGRHIPVPNSTAEPAETSSTMHSMRRTGVQCCRTPPPTTRS